MLARTLFVSALVVASLVGGGLSAQVILPPPDPVPFGGPEARAEIPHGAEILGKGPVHEAYAQPAIDKPIPTPLIPREPPALIEELPPDQRPTGSMWIPGYWQWDDDRTDFLWVSGFWRVPPPNRRWVPGQYQRVETGWRWVPGFWAAQQQAEVAYLPPPPASLENGPATPAPQEDALYIPGYWVYQENDYRWKAGFWSANRPGWVWCPAQYYWTPSGYVFREGYWDAPLEQRGCLFAPVVFQPGVVCPGFVWRPTYVVTYESLPSALFVRPTYGHYYFGDYYAPRYVNSGFSFWFDFRYGRSCHDPLYDYYHRSHRGRGWEAEVRGIYIGRTRGTLPLPPANLRAQLNPGAVVIGNPRQPVTVPTSLAPFSPRVMPAGVTLSPIAPPDRARIVQQARDLRNLGYQRAHWDRGPGREQNRPRTLSLQFPTAPPPTPPAGPNRVASMPEAGGRPLPALNFPPPTRGYLPGSGYPGPGAGVGPGPARGPARGPGSTGPMVPSGISPLPSFPSSPPSPGRGTGPGMGRPLRP